MLLNSYIKVSYTFTIIRFISEFTLKFINAPDASSLGMGV